jgi:DNA-binding response OmpR family regulator
MRRFVLRNREEEGTMKLLMIDQDREWVEMLTGWLRTRGCEVARACDENSAKAVWAQQCPDLVLVDASLQGVDALALCRGMRKIHEAFIFVLSAHPDIQEEVRCLEAGADVYLRKPFSPALLLARIQAVSRRAGWTVPLSSAPLLGGDPLLLDPYTRHVTLNGKTVHLTPHERKLLRLLATNEVCTLEQMVTCLWGEDGKEDLSSIKVCIYHLRHTTVALLNLNNIPPTRRKKASCTSLCHVTCCT